MPRAPRLVEMSVPLAPGLTTDPGNFAFALTSVKPIADAGSSHVSCLSLGTHTGTHVDAPLTR